jgi:D-beta-D-heptose 7-phosphate kinase / D-beta-D-heptose 1-phosphate adenosyltransferase
VNGRLTVVGDALLDRDVEGRVQRLCPEAPVPVLEEHVTRWRPGGAGLAAALAAGDGCEVTLVTALGRDSAGRQLARLLDDARVRVVDIGLGGATPVKVRFRCDGRLLLRLDEGVEPGALGDVSDAVHDAIEDTDAVLVSDYGRGLAAVPRLRDVLAAAPQIIWDPHPRGARPVPGVRLVTPNQAEAAGLVPEAGEPGEQARTLRRRWNVDAVAVTLGRHGAVLAQEDKATFRVPARPTGGDACGAGDRFATAAAAALAEGAWLPDAVAHAVAAASAFVAAGGASSFRLRNAPGPDAEARELEAVIAGIRAAGGRVVATGGCFDLLHAGHVALLEAARALGDCLVVCLNSDESVRRLKGPDRPLVAEEDRAAVLGALASVDGVVVFEEETPEAVLEWLRPDVWAKGGDYALEELPEADLVSRWGGETVILPYVEGRSTTRLLEDIAARALR